MFGWGLRIAAVFLFIAAGACGTDSSDGAPRATPSTSSTVPPRGRPPILWSTLTDGADAMVATDARLLVISSEYVTAYDRASGVQVWDAYLAETSGWTPSVVRDGVLVVKTDGSTYAYDVANGHTVPVPANVELPTTGPPRLPEGYRTEGNRLFYGDRLVWTKRGSKDLKRQTAVARVGNLTVVNDFDEGLRVVDDNGAVRASPRLGARQVDETPPLVAGPNAYAVTADGKLYAISAV